MFPRTENRIGTILRRSVDAAIDFATLGEYGLSSAMEGPSLGGLAPLPPRPDVLSVALAPPAVPAAGPLAPAPLVRPGGRAKLSPADAREAFRLQATSAAARARRDGDRAAEAGRARRAPAPDVTRRFGPPEIRVPTHAPDAALVAAGHEHQTAADAPAPASSPTPAPAAAIAGPHRRKRGAPAASTAHRGRTRAGSATRTDQLCFFID